LKKGRGFELTYKNLSDRRKFIRTVWLTVIAAVIVILFIVLNINWLIILLCGIVMGVGCVFQLLTTYVQWKHPTRKRDNEGNEKNTQEDKNVTALIYKISIGLSLIFVWICAGFILYGKLVAQVGDVTLFAVVGAVNLFCLLNNLAGYNRTMREDDNEEEEDDENDEA
jgi:hypothetical protein